jgi:hypothetical protein
MISNKNVSCCGGNDDDINSEIVSTHPQFIHGVTGGAAWATAAAAAREEVLSLNQIVDLPTNRR